MISADTIEEVKNRLIKAYNPLFIYVFGSYAWGNPHDASDLDLLVVVEKSEEKPHVRSVAGLKVLWGLEISKDLLVYTLEEFDSRTSDETTLPYKVKSTGRVLYART